MDGEHRMNRYVAFSAVITVAGLACHGVHAAGAPRFSSGEAVAGRSQRPSDKYKVLATSPDLERRDQPVTDEDLRILTRADVILSTPAAWNRHDTRVCSPKAETWSLFCAMQKASHDVLGEERYRAVALQEVRFAVEDAMRSMNVQFQHRMTDYNNLASTRFEDIKTVLKVAKERVSTRLASQRK
jgi:hypothetical protein